MKERYFFLIVPTLISLYHIPNIKGIGDVITLLIYIFINFSICIFWGAVMKGIDGIKRLNLLGIGAWILWWVCLDQVIKLVISCLNVEGIIWNDIVGIKTVMNKEQMAILNFLKINLGDSTIAFIKLIIIVAISVVFLSIKKKNRNCIYSFIFLLAASIATLLDSMIWGYTLDYIYFAGFTCYDLKDFYVNTALGFLLIEQTKWIKTID